MLQSVGLQESNWSLFLAERPFEPIMLMLNPAEISKHKDYILPGGALKSSPYPRSLFLPQRILQSRRTGVPSSCDLLHTAECLLSAPRLRARLVKKGIPERVAVVELIRATFVCPTVCNVFDVIE